jgi:hypothetical protein
MHNSIWRAIGWSVLLTAFGPLGASQGGLAGTQAEPDALGTPLPSAAIYDPDPNHLWNRLFAVFYRQKIANNSYDRNMTGWGMNRVGEPHWIGPDVLDPPLGYHPKFLLEDEPFARCIRSTACQKSRSRRDEALTYPPETEEKKFEPRHLVSYRKMSFSTAC